MTNHQWSYWYYSLIHISLGDRTVTSYCRHSSLNIWPWENNNKRDTGMALELHLHWGPNMTTCALSIHSWVGSSAHPFKRAQGVCVGVQRGAVTAARGPSHSGHRVSACWFPLMRTGTKGECSCQWTISQSIPLWVQNNSLSICSRGQMVGQSGNQGWPQCGMRACVCVCVCVCALRGAYRWWK